MNDRDARERRYLRLLAEGFSETEARQMVKPKKRTVRLRKPLPLERDDSHSSVVVVRFR